MIARKLTKIIHILTRNDQYGYKEGISTIAAIIKIDQYIGHANRDAEILLMGLSNAFGAINRTLLWATVYKKVYMGEMIKRIQRGHRGAQRAPKYEGEYGELRGSNNIGVFQGSAVSALLFIIYMGDMMGDYGSMRRRSKLPIRIAQDRPHEQASRYYGKQSKCRNKEMGGYEKRIPSSQKDTRSRGGKQKHDTITKAT